MKKIQKLFFSYSLAATTALIVVPGHADEVDLAFSNDTAKIKYSRSGVVSKRSQANVSYFHHQDGADMFDVDLLVGDANSANQLLIGGKLFYASDNDLDGTGLALGFSGSASLAHKIYLKGHAFYAPSVTSFNDLENYQELEIRLTYQVIPEAEVSLGYRNAEFDINNGGDLEIQDDVFLALTLNF